MSVHGVSRVQHRPRQPNRVRDWLNTTNAGALAVVFAAFGVGLLINWALHPTFPPRLLLEEPQEGSWMWLLQAVFVWGRGLTATAAVLLGVGLIAWWSIRLWRSR